MESGSDLGALGLEIAAPVWVRATGEEVWKAGFVKSLRGDDLTIEVQASGARARREDVVLSVKKEPPGFCKRNPELLKADRAAAMDDLSLLSLLNEPELLHAIESRFTRDVIYTSTGPVLLAVNPFRTLPRLYDSDCLNTFLSTEDPEALLPPHVYRTSWQAYRLIKCTGAPQTILVSGESGSGKTETTKFVMRYLALAGSGGSEAALSVVERQVLESIPLLEAFGNAKTLRNDNSSRFGKFTELQFSHHGQHENPRLASAQTHCYLLEKVRVVGQQQGERNFHIFYQVLSFFRARVTEMPETPLELRNLALPEGMSHKPEDYAYLNKSGCHDLSDHDEVHDFLATVGAFSALKMAEDVHSIVACTFAVLQLGNIVFEAPEGNSEGSQVSAASKADRCLTFASTLLGVEIDQLEGMLCLRKMQVVGERYSRQTITQSRTVAQAMEGRDALARHLYGVIFLYLVRRINDALSPGSSRSASAAHPFVGVLDIFGFEFFENNSFEQLCINFTNELLQQHFNEVIFEFEAALYAKEGVSWDPLDFPDNKDIVDLIGSIQAPRGLSLEGLLPMLDEEGSLPGGSSTGWFNKLASKYRSHQIFQVVMRRRGNFLVNHFAGAVEYDSQNFLFKNKDTLSPDAVESMKASANEFLRSRFQEEGRSFGTQTEAATGRVTKAKAYSVSLEFRQQLRQLMASVRSTTPHFIRCVKPNPQNKPQVLHRSSVVEQLRYQGVLEAIRVSRAGYPVRHRHREAVLEYWRLEKPMWSRLEFEVGRGEYAEAARLLFGQLRERVAHVLPDAPGYGLQIGLHQIFMKREVAATLDAAMRKARIQASVLIQARRRGLSAQRFYRTVKKAVPRIQALSRGKAARRLAEELRRQRAATKIQAVQRGRLARAEYKEKSEAVAALQEWIRSVLARQRFLAMVASACKLQRWFHRTVIWIRRRRRTRAALPIQNAWRGHLARREAAQRRSALHGLQRACRQLVRLWQSQAVQEIRNQGLLRRPSRALHSPEELAERLEDMPLGKLLAAINSLERCNAALNFEAKATRVSCDRIQSELQEMRRNSIAGVIGQVYGCCTMREESAKR